MQLLYGEEGRPSVFSRLYDAFLQPSGLRITQFLILATLNEQQSASVNALAERLTSSGQRWER